MGSLRGSIRDAVSGATVAAKVRVVGHTGQVIHPRDSLRKVGSGDEFFYCSGEFSVPVPGGKTDVIIERGTEYKPLHRSLSTPATGATEVDFELHRWIDLPEQGWYPGNTHIHYNELETRPDERLRLDPEVNDLSLTAISVLQRGEIPYASNRYPPGFLTDFSTDHRQVICGEETRHNSLYGGGYGHVMLLNLRNLVEPVSRGDLVSAFDPDYPPLCHACDDARTQGGLVIWCHNGNGMEAPVAAALGKLDAFNMFDPCWKSSEYGMWYQLLNCGIRLPASTGSDWYICSNNRVYVDTQQAFTYKSWLEGLRDGRSFITNGPSLMFSVNGEGPGSQLGPGRCSVHLEWLSHLPLTHVEIVADGLVVERRELTGDEGREGHWQVDVDMTDGWLAARAEGVARDSFLHPVYAHASPVYVGSGIPPTASREAAAHFTRQIDTAIDLITDSLRYTTDAQRQEVLHLFHSGRSIYERLGI
jgi:hypothetical protein